jgi:hypothetical protein
MKKLMKYAAATAIAALMSGPAFATIDYSEDFETFTEFTGTDISPLGGGWLIFANVFANSPACDPYLYGYGVFDAPNKGSGFSNIASGDTGKALNVFSDYDNGDHANNACIEASVFQERVFSAADAGSYTFMFDAQAPAPLGTDVTTFGFIKLLDPNNGYNTDVFISVDTETAGSKSIEVALDASADGKILQWGFASIASNYEASGRLYDNVTFALTPEEPPVGPGDGFEGVPIPMWALLLMAAMLAWVGATRLRSHRQ